MDFPAGRVRRFRWRRVLEMGSDDSSVLRESAGGGRDRGRAVRVPPG